MVNKNLPENLDYGEKVEKSSLSAYDYLVITSMDAQDDEGERFRKEHSEDFREAIKGLSDAQLYIIKKSAKECENDEAIQMLEEERPGDLSGAIEGLSLEQKYELVKSTIYCNSENFRSLDDVVSGDSAGQLSLQELNDFELRAFMDILERYFNDKDNAELIGQEKDRREKMKDDLMKQRVNIGIKQNEQVSHLKEDLFDDGKMPYDSLYLINGEWTEEQKQEFREALKQLSDAQLYILKQVALERECNVAVELIEEERPGDLGKSLENLTLQQKEEIAKLTVMPEAFCPLWFDGIYAILDRFEKIPDEKTKKREIEKWLSGFTSEEIGVFSYMVENYMRDKATADLLKSGLKEDLFDEERIIDMDKILSLTSVSSVDKKHLVDQINMRDFKEKDFIVKCLLGGFEGGEKENIRRIQFLLIGDKDGYKEGGKGHILWPLSKYGTDGTMGEETWDALIAYITDPDNQYLDLSKVVVEGISEDLKDQINTKHFKEKEYIIKCLSGGFEGGVKENVRRLQFLLIGDKNGYRKGEKGHKTGLLSKEGTDGLMGEETLQALAQYIDDQKNQCLVLDDIVLPRISSLNLNWVVEEINKSECEDKEYIIKCLSGGFEGGIKENVRRLQFLLIGDKNGYKEGELGHKTGLLSKCGTDGLMGKETWKALMYYVTDTQDNGYDTFFLGRDLDEYERRLEELSRMMPYVEAWKYEDDGRTEENREDFRRRIMNLSDAQLCILKVYLKDELESSEAVKIVEEERPGDLGKALENLTLRQKYELARSTAMPEGMCPEWFDSVYRTLLKIEREPDENTRSALKKELVYDDENDEMGVYSYMIEDYMRDKETVELLRKNAHKKHK